MSQTTAFPGIEFEHDNARIYTEYRAWLPKVDLMPIRASFDPASVADILPTTVIRATVGPQVIAMRLGGKSIVSHPVRLRDVS